MQTRDWIEIILAVLGGLSAVLLTGGYAYGSWKQGSNQNKLDNDSIYKGRIEALELEARLQSSDIEKLTKEVRDLHEAIDLRDKKFAEAILTLQGKDPTMADFIMKGTEYMASTKPVLVRMDKWLNKESF